MCRHELVGKTIFREYGEVYWPPAVRASQRRVQSVHTTERHTRWLFGRGCPVCSDLDADGGRSAPRCRLILGVAAVSTPHPVCTNDTRAGDLKQRPMAAPLSIGEHRDYPLMRTDLTTLFPRAPLSNLAVDLVGGGKLDLGEGPTTLSLECSL